MSKLRCHISISLDGCVAGPNQSEENPLGEGGEGLHDWVVPLAAWREAHGKYATLVELGVAFKGEFLMHEGFWMASLKAKDGTVLSVREDSRLTASR